VNKTHLSIISQYNHQQFGRDLHFYWKYINALQIVAVHLCGH